MGRRGSLGGTVLAVLLGIALGAGAVGQQARAAQSRSSAPIALNKTAGVCDSTRIHGVTANDTGSPIHVIQYGWREGNHWCRVPKDEIRAHFSDGWHIADNAPPVAMHILYRLHNGDEVLFTAELRKHKGTGTGCSFMKVVRTARQFECKAEVVAAAEHVAFVRFVVLPRPAAGPSLRHGKGSGLH